MSQSLILKIGQITDMKTLELIQDAVKSRATYIKAHAIDSAKSKLCVGQRVSFKNRKGKDVFANITEIKKTKAFLEDDNGSEYDIHIVKLTIAANKKVVKKVEKEVEEEVEEKVEEEVVEEEEEEEEVF